MTKKCEDSTLLNKQICRIDPFNQMFLLPLEHKDAFWIIMENVIIRFDISMRVHAA